MNYVTYHLHTENSLLDSCTNYKLYVDKAVELGQTAIGFSEHGVIYDWVAKKMYANSKGLKYLHGIEIYLTATHDVKVRDNYHTVLIAKNYEGVKEINRLVDLSNQPDHFYYKPRISFEEFFNISDNVIKISACLASPLNKYPASIDENDEEAQKKAREMYNRLLQTYDYYEIQPHIKSLEQINYNKMLYQASLQYGKPLIAATDTHSLDDYKAECRRILLKAKNIAFTNEDEFDLTYKSYDELVEMFRQQGALPMDVVLEAIDNTNKMADSVEDFELDTSFKYPVLYDDEEQVFTDRVYRMYHEKLDEGIIKPNPRYEENIKEELRVFKKIGMIGFMLFMSELTCWCWDNGIPIGYCRGSVGGSTIAYLTDITDVDPIVWGTTFSRFANEDRKEIGDIDLDISPSQRDLVFNHIIEEFGEDKTAYVLAISTISDKGTIDEIGRALEMPLNEVKIIKEKYSEYADAIQADEDKIKKIEEIDGYENKNKYVKEKLRCEEDIKYNNECLKNLEEIQYPELFYYFDGLKGTAVAQSLHPAGIVVSPVSLPDNYGTFWHDGKHILCINMDEIHEVSLVKYDILGLRNIAIIKDTCELAHIPYPKAHMINWNDENVWAHIADSPVGIFQFESGYAYNAMKRFKCKSVDDLSLVNAAIRPSGETYRDDLLAHKKNKNPSKMIDDLLASNNGFLVYQCDTIKFLTDICGLSGSEADNVRRAIGRKQKDRLDATLPAILDGYCSKSDKPRVVAEKEAREFLQIIENSANYQFGYNHSTGYSMIGYVCGYLRYYYPKEFITSYLLNANNDDDIKQGTALAKQLNIPIHNIRFRHSTAEYSCDKNGIYKGIASVKYLNKEAADDLYSIKDENFDTFTDLLIRISDLRVDSRKLSILIMLDFFQEFGDISFLLKVNDMFTKYYGKKQIKKEKALQDGLDFDLVRKHCKKETQKTFLDFDSVGFLKDFELGLDKSQYVTSLQKKIDYQIENLGYIDIVDKKYAGYCVALSTDLLYSPKINLYALANGNVIPVKVNKKVFSSNPIRRGDIVKVKSQYKKPKMKKVDDGWVETDEREWWITDYKVINNIN